MLQKSDAVIPFLVGLGIGVAAAVLLAPSGGKQNRKHIRDTAHRAGDALKKRAGDLADATDDVLTKGKRAWAAEQEKDARAMSALADRAKTVAGQIVDKSRDIAHDTGKSLEAGGKRLQDA